MGRGTRIERSLLLGNGAWVSDSQRSEVIENGQRVYGVGEWCCLLLCLLWLVGWLPVAGRPLSAGKCTGSHKQLHVLSMCCSRAAQMLGFCQQPPARAPPAGENCFLRRCIVDENASIGNNVQIINKSGVKEADRSSDSEWSGAGWAACAGWLAGDAGGRLVGNESGRLPGNQGRQVAVKAGPPKRAGLQVCRLTGLHCWLVAAASPHARHPFILPACRRLHDPGRH